MDVVESPFELRCSPHNRDLRPTGNGLRWQCPGGCDIPAPGGIPRFAPSRHYAGSFGLQWNTFRRTQLDSVTGTTISRDRLTRVLGGSLKPLAGRLVLEVGCGAGRFTELLLDAGARVVAVDLSSAVDANLANNGHHPQLLICQADVMSLPFAPAQFDAVVAIGMIQHTPDPVQTIAKLCAQLTPNGLLALDHYAPGGQGNRSRRLLRPVMLALPPRLSLAAVRALVAGLWPLHRALFRASGRVRGAGRLYNLLARVSPVFDYQRSYPELSPSMLRAWAILDTHDGLTDRYKHLRTAEQIAAALAACGMTQLETRYAGNGVEARARAAVIASRCR
jgi:SAM-dependent methyltransferase